MSFAGNYENNWFFNSKCLKSGLNRWGLQGLSSNSRRKGNRIKKGGKFLWKSIFNIFKDLF